MTKCTIIGTGDKWDVAALLADTDASFGLGRMVRFANTEHPALRKLQQLDLFRFVGAEGDVGLAGVEGMAQ